MQRTIDKPLWVDGFLSHSQYNHSYCHKVEELHGIYTPMKADQEGQRWSRESHRGTAGNFLCRLVLGLTRDVCYFSWHAVLELPI